jgi:hypothetical protein
MTRALVVAERPFRDLRSHAILQALAARPGMPGPLLLATAAAQAPQGFVPVGAEPDPAALGVSRVILAGVFQDRAPLVRALRLAARAVAAGAALDARGLSLERAAARQDAPEGVEVLDAATCLEAREHHTANALMVWRVAAPIVIDAYPERRVPPEPIALPGLPERGLLGLSLLGGADQAKALQPRLPALRQRLAGLQGMPILPLPVEGHASPFDDLAGTRDVAAALLPDAPWLLPEAADPAWRRRHLMPRRLKGLLARCAVVVTNQDLVAALAIDAGVPVLALAYGPDRRIVSCLAALANALPAGCDLFHPPPAGA